MKANKFKLMAFVDRTFYLWLAIGSVLIYFRFR